MLVAQFTTNRPTCVYDIRIDLPSLSNDDPDLASSLVYLQQKLNKALLGVRRETVSDPRWRFSASQETERLCHTIRQQDEYQRLNLPLNQLESR